MLSPQREELARKKAMKQGNNSSEARPKQPQASPSVGCAARYGSPEDIKEETMKSNTWKHSRSTLTLALMTAALLIVAAAPATAGEITAIGVNPNPIASSPGSTAAFDVKVTGASGNMSNSPTLTHCSSLSLELDGSTVVLTCTGSTTTPVPGVNFSQPAGQALLPLLFPGLLSVDSDVPCGTYTFDYTVTVSVGIDFGSGVKSRTLSLSIVVAGCESEGCSHGYWKNHTSEWPSPYTTSTQLQGPFFIPAVTELSFMQVHTFGMALDYPGGPDLGGAARILLRNAVASLLNAEHSGVAYPKSAAEVKAAVNAALASLDRDTMLALEEELDELNNLGCPLE